MTPKEKAIKLVKKYSNIVVDVFDVNFNGRLIRFDNKTLVEKSAKECAIIAVDEIINTLNHDIRDIDVRGSVLLDLIKYYEQVKTEIENL